MDRRIAQPPPPGLAKIDSNQWTEPFWAAARRHALCFARCHDCGHFRMPPTPFCPRCHAQDIDWVEVTGGASLYSYTIVDRAIMPGMDDNLPYVPAIVEFADAPGIRLISNIVKSELGRIRIGQALRLEWIDHDDGYALPVFSVEQEEAEERNS